MPVPTHDNLLNPFLKALHQLGGSASNLEAEEKVAEILNLNEGDVSEIHKGGRTKLAYNLAWARTYLKLYGLLENSERGIWSLTLNGRKTKNVDVEEVKKYIRNKEYEARRVDIKFFSKREVEETEKLWQDELLKEMLELSPQAFERLCQRILRESGFIQVEIIGRSSDGGIDGRGMFRIGGLLGFRVIFQCKRYSGSVPVNKIRDFRGAMAGRVNKGLFITTGTFTREAKLEATRDGAAPIDLIDGERLIEIMKELELGVRVKKEEVVEVNQDWFKDF